MCEKNNGKSATVFVLFAICSKSEWCGEACKALKIIAIGYEPSPQLTSSGVCALRGEKYGKTTAVFVLCGIQRGWYGEGMKDQKEGKKLPSTWLK